MENTNPFEGTKYNTLLKQLEEAIFLAQNTESKQECTNACFDIYWIEQEILRQEKEGKIS